jgi:hypothetical protein
VLIASTSVLLGLVDPKGNPIQMQYTNERPVIDANRLHSEEEACEHARPLLDRLMQQKSAGWSYEREYRVFVDLRQCEKRGDLYFKTIPDNFLTRVILGFRCPLKEDEIQNSLKAVNLNAAVARAKMCLTKYSIIWD